MLGGGGGEVTFFDIFRNIRNIHFRIPSPPLKKCTRKCWCSWTLLYSCHLCIKYLRRLNKRIKKIYITVYSYAGGNKKSAHMLKDLEPDYCTFSCSMYNPLVSDSFDTEAVSACVRTVLGELYSMYLKKYNQQFSYFEKHTPINPLHPSVQFECL